MKLLAIDIGASSGRAILGELGDGSLAMTEVHRFENRMVERGEHKHWDAGELHGHVLASLEKADPAVESVGIDTWGVDYGYLDAGGDLLADPFAYRDERTLAVVDDVHERVGGRERLYGINGLQYLSFNTIYQIAEDAASRPELVERAARVQMMPELLSQQLTGACAAEYSIASTSGLIDATTRTWSDDLLRTLGIPRELFTDPVSRPGEAHAPLRAEIASKTDCQAEVILPGCHDTASAVAACPISGENAMYISSGTWSLAGVELDEPVLTPEAMAANFTNEGGVEGTIRFLKNVMGLWLVQELRRGWAEAGAELEFGAICDRAAEAPAFASLFDPNQQRFLAPKDMLAEVRAECGRTGQPSPDGVGAVARAVFESLAMAYRQCIEQIQDLTGRTVACVNIVGGGVQNRLLCQMTADACGVPVVAGPVEATAIGNLLVQAIARGAVSDIAAARQLVRDTAELVTYEPQSRDEWEAAWERWKGLRASGQV
jgi:rhamnulokinase